MKIFDNKIIAFILLNALAVTSCNSQQLLYEPIGEMDKPLPKIAIKINNDKENKGSKVFILDKNTFELLRNYVVDTSLRTYVGDNYNYEYGCYMVTYFTDSKKIEYIIKSRDESRNFFDGQLQIIKSNIQLYNEINVLIKRLGAVPK
ncbi:hypothetical protein ACFPVY_07220 [Flavobacterium qiangtangense]|uniref:Lipoprotein n=1 Tax=Flavobacterium qiangtangense TaxID=1442595 RepID=A0ABW1PMJ9_9FLAO